MPLSADQIKAVNFARPATVPISASMVPAVWMKYRDDMDAIVRRHPILFPHYKGNDNYDAVWSETYHAGNHTDEWGCVWSNVQDGMEAIVTHHPVPTREHVRTLKAPDVLKPELKHGFMYLRLADLRGFEELMLDFAEDAPELQTLIDIVLRHNLERLELMRQRFPKEDLYWFGDDLGMQTSLPMGAAKWRKYLKPCFAELFGRWRADGRMVFFHTDGCCWEVIPDLHECGVQIINPQYRANGLANLVKVCKGKICCALDLDRQLFPFATPKEIDEHIRECITAMGSREGGLWAHAEIGMDYPLENIEAIFTALEKYRTIYTN